MKNYKQHFEGKKITMLGLGLLGRGLNCAKFLAECGADLIITDLKTAEQLKPTLRSLSKYKNIKYVLGEHRLEDFRGRDYILKAAGVPIDSSYIAEAKKNNIPIKMDASWFAELAPEVKIVGTTGTRGKSTTTYLTYDVLKSAEKTKTIPGQVFLGGNIRGVATLPLLKKAKAGDVAVLELDSWQLQGFGEAKISPQISIFTNFLKDHLNYYLKVSRDEAEAMQIYFMDKAQIFAHQKPSDFLILDEEISKIISERFRGKIPGTVLKIGSLNRIKNWKLQIKGEHNQKHVLRALEVAKIFGLKESAVRKVVENFKSAPGRQELIRIYRGIKIYNDTNSTTPDAALVALRSLGDNKKKNLVLICGGADKGLEMSSFASEIKEYCRAVVLLDGTGTKKLLQNFPVEFSACPVADNLKSAVKTALTLARKGDSLILSPAFASFGMFKNEYDRGDKFVALVKKLK